MRRYQSSPTKRGRRWSAALLVLVACGFSHTSLGREHGNGDSTNDEITIRLVPSPDSKRPAAIELLGLPQATFEELVEAKLTSELWSAVFAVYVQGGTKDDPLPPILGGYEVRGRAIRFTPRYPLALGMRYRAVFDLSRLPRVIGREVTRLKPVVKDFAIPAAKPGEPTRVEHVYPSADRLPENQLKFYIHFSAPVRQGEAYEHIRLLDGSGSVVEGAFLELGEELWDPSGRRLTLFIDPGRIKRGLKPREDLGPVLEEGRTYMFIVADSWRDVAGRRLAREYRKVFQVGPPDEAPPDLSLWKLKVPTAGSSSPLRVTFPEPLDHAMLGRVVGVRNVQGDVLVGRVEISENETVWRFIPRRSWSVDTYQLVVDTTLEDLAGNSIGRRFEVDVFGPIQKRITTRTVTRSFQVNAPPAH